MKKLILLFLALGTFTLAHAQQFARNGFSIGPEVNFPSQSVYNIGYGASAQADIFISGKFALGLSGGYTKLHYKGSIISTFGSQKPSEFVPLKAGIIYGAGSGLYLEGDLGDVLETSTNINGSKRSLFAFSVGPSSLVRLTDKQSVDIGVRYEQWSEHTLKQIALRVAYRIGW